MPSIRQIAKLAGVAPITVSRALRDDPHVLPETRAKIMEIASLYNYRPNRTVRALVTGRSATLGVILPRIDASFYSTIMGRVIEHAFSEGYHTILLHNHNKVVHTCRAIQTLVEQRVEGIIIAGGHHEFIPYESLLEMWSNGVVPVGVDLPFTDRHIDHVMTDERQLAELAVDYLLSLGHQRIAFVGPMPPLARNRRWISLTEVFHSKGLSTKYFVHSYLGKPEDAVLTQLRAFPHPPTAIIAFSDGTAARLMQQALFMGLNIPRDLSILGCGNLEFSADLYPPLTTIEQYPEEIGKRVAEILFTRLDEQAEPTERHPETVVVPASLVLRNSCAPPK